MSLAQHHEQYVTLKSGDRFYYAEHGVGNTDTIVLIVGLGLQLVYWPSALIERLVASGFRVICFDNRDAGRSVRSDTPHPSLLQQLRGRSPKGAYGLERMAEDTAQLLEALNISSAHIAGMSMGGMIAQTLGRVELRPTDTFDVYFLDDRESPRRATLLFNAMANGKS